MPKTDGERTDLSDWERLTDGEEQQKRLMRIEVQEQASKELMDEMKAEREELIAHFDKDTDLKQKVLIKGVQKISVLGVIKYHQLK